MFRFGCGKYVVTVHRGSLPPLYADDQKHALLTQEFDWQSSSGEICVVALGTGMNWPVLVVGQRFEPHVGGFDPGILLVPEPGTLFIGAGKRLLAYSVKQPELLWEDTTDVRFWGWNQFGNHVLMSAELELAAWDLAGKKLWTTFVEPPWEYEVVGDEVQLDVMGKKSAFPISTGPRRRQ